MKTTTNSCVELAISPQINMRTPHISHGQGCRLSNLLVLSLLLGSNFANAQRYVEITGEIAVTSYPGGGTNNAASAKSPRIISFVCVTGTNEWRIENDFVRGGESSWCFDGTNVYESLRMTTINIWESHDGHPLGNPGVNIPWLALCSGTYLKREGRLIPLPVDDLHHTPDRFAYSDKTKTFDDGIGLPQAVDLFMSQSLFQTSVDDFEKEWLSPRRYQDYPKSVVSKLPDGALTFHYAATESTNFLGWNFPTQFEYFQVGRKYVQNGDWFCRGIGTVKSIRKSSKPGNLFMPGMQKTIVDWRFRDVASQVNALMYTSTNAFASPTNDPVLQEKFAKRIARMKRGP